MIDAAIVGLGWWGPPMLDTVAAFEAIAEAVKFEGRIREV
jgi:hypothetical protein